MSAYKNLKFNLESKEYSWLITCVAGFISSNLLEAKLKLNQKVVGLDNFSTGQQHKLNKVQSIVTSGQRKNFSSMQADVCNLANCQAACDGVDYLQLQSS